MKKIRLGKFQKNLLDFAKRYNYSWHGFSNDCQTKRIVKSLVKRELLEINKFNQFKLKEIKNEN